MHIHTTVATANHVKSIINEIRKSNQLPFQEILPAESIARRLANFEYRDRTFTPETNTMVFYHCPFMLLTKPFIHDTKAELSTTA